MKNLHYCVIKYYVGASRTKVYRCNPNVLAMFVPCAGGLCISSTSMSTSSVV